MTSRLESMIAAVSPKWAAHRAQYRQVLNYYEAARPNSTKKQRREPGSGNVALQRAGTSLREQARHYEQNYDIALGALNALVINTIGPAGISVEPQPRMADGEIHDAFSEQLLELWRDWCKRPEVTWCHDWASAQRMLARSWFRDGEVFSQVIAGITPYLDHGTKVPLSLEMLEADYVPLTLMGTEPTVIQGVEINAWGRPVAYNVYKQHPADIQTFLSASMVKRITADNMLHIATRHRIRQLRGVSTFASVMLRLDDIKDYEESERVAAKVAASMAGFIRKGSPDLYDDKSSPGARDLKFKPGMIFDDLMPGEEIGTIDTNRPNANLENFRSGQLRAAASGFGTTYSTLSKNYNGTYSAQRQELVEGWGAYATLSSEFAARIVRPVYERFVAVALAARLVRLPPDVVPDSIDDCIAIAPQMPWINPKDEADAWAVLEDRCFASGPEIIRKRGANPHDVVVQESKWRREKDKRGIPDVTTRSDNPIAAVGKPSANSVPGSDIQP